MPSPPAWPSAESQPSRQSSNAYSLRLTRRSHPLYSSKKPSCELSAGSTYSEMKKQPPSHCGAMGAKGGCDGGGCGGDWSNPAARMDNKAAVPISRVGCYFLLVRRLHPYRWPREDTLPVPPIGLFIPRNARALAPGVQTLKKLESRRLLGAASVRPTLPCSPAGVPPRGAMNILETHSLKTDSRIGLAKMEGLLNSVLGKSLSPSNPLHRG
jgi:hypothetical protein